LNYYNTIKAHKRSVNSVRKDISRDSREEDTIKTNSKSMLLKNNKTVELLGETLPAQLIELAEENQLISIGLKNNNDNSIVVSDFVKEASLE
jgi:hypothetical protein